LYNIYHNLYSVNPARQYTYHQSLQIYVGTLWGRANYNRELKTLCEKGPVNYINVTSLNLVYRNQFCALCHGADLLLMDFGLPQLPKMTALTLELFWDKKAINLEEIKIFP